jgi:type II secretory pathway pseudopilin PulG
MVEILAVVGVIAVLLGMGCLLFRSMRSAAHVAVAETRLKQVATGLELYFRQHNCYPPEGSDLTVALAPYVENPTVFENPLRDEERPGDTLNTFYKQPSLDELDRPGIYVVCFVPESKSDPVVVLETADRISRKSSAGEDLSHSQRDSLIAFLYPQEETGGDTPTGGQEPPSAPEEPGSGGSPEDYTTESPEGIICLNESHDCLETSVQVASAELVAGEADGTSVPMTVEVQFFAKSGSPNGSTLPLFDGQPVDTGDTDSFVVSTDAKFALRFRAEYATWVIQMRSDGDPESVLTLRRGDRPAEFDPHGQPKRIGWALRRYLDPATGQVAIGDNQVLYLVEFESSDPASPQFDLQDLVVVMSLGIPASLAECEYAVPGDESGSGSDDGFDVADGGNVVTKVCSDVTINVVGSQFGYADGSLVPIKASANIDDPKNPNDGTWFDLNGGQAVHGGEAYTDTTVNPGTRVLLRGEIIGAYERWLWTSYGYPLAYASNDGSGQVLLYKQGDAPPDFAPGYPCQAAAADLVAPYIDPQTGVVTIASNQALYLWDFNPRYTGTGIDYQDLIILATAVSAAGECEDATGGGTQPPEAPTVPQPTLALSLIEGSTPGGQPPTGHSVGGSLNINPNNNEDFEFLLVKPDGSQITRDDLLASRGDLTYTGPAKLLRVQPKGNGNQNAITVDGETLSVRNGTLYTITSETMTVHLYNDKANGAAMGHWMIDSLVADNATVEGFGDNAGTSFENRDFTVRVRNTAEGDLHAARGVHLAAETLEGAAYVQALNLGSSQDLGDLSAGQTKDLPVQITTNAAWNTAYHKVIRVAVKIASELNWPEENVGKQVVITVNGPVPPKPVLAITPATVRTTNTSQTFQIQNTAGTGNDAKGVRYSVTVVSGSRYVNSVSYNKNVGNIASGATANAAVTVNIKNSTWRNVAAGTEIQLTVKITAEENDPTTNVGKTASYTIYK